jgi:hypothetical protein
MLTNMDRGARKFGTFLRRCHNLGSRPGGDCFPITGFQLHKLLLGLIVNALDNSTSVEGLSMTFTCHVSAADFDWKHLGMIQTVSLLSFYPLLVTTAFQLFTPAIETSADVGRLL